MSSRSRRRSSADRHMLCTPVPVTFSHRPSCRVLSPEPSHIEHTSITYHSWNFSISRGLVRQPSESTSLAVSPASLSMLYGIMDENPIIVAAVVLAENPLPSHQSSSLRYPVRCASSRYQCEAQPRFPTSM